MLVAGQPRPQVVTFDMPNVVDEMTTRWLDEAGITNEMRVVDIGCGPGLVTCELARRVGPRGTVYAVDRNPAVLKMAQERCTEAGFNNVAFIEGGFDLPPPEGALVDAAVGRRVLMYQPDPVAAVKQLARAVRSGGLVLFHEHDTVNVPSPSTLPLHDQVRGWLRAMLEGEGANLQMGFDLHRVLSDAGLDVERVCSEANVFTPTSEYPVGHIIRAVLPRLEGLGITTEQEARPDSLDERLGAERQQAGATCVWELVFCGWARKG